MSTSCPEVCLRALEPEDLELVFQIENDADIWQWSGSSQPLSRYTVRQYLAEQQADIYQDGQLRLVAEAGGKPVGIVDLTSFDPRHRRAEVGIVILPGKRRQGMALAALQALHAYTARHLQLRCLYAFVAEHNEAAQRLFRTADYQASGVLQRWILGKHTATLFQLLL